MSGDGPLVLWGVGTSRTFRAHWALHELGLSHEVRAVETRSEAARAPAFLELNPLGKIPVLQRGDFVLRESAAIVLHLAERHPEPLRLLPEAPEARAHCLQWCFFAMMELDATGLYVIRRHADLPETYGAAPAAVEAAGAYVTRQLTGLEAALADGRAYVLGSDFSAADILLATCLIGARNRGLAMSDPIAAYLNRLSRRPAFQTAYQANCGKSAPPAA